MTATISFMTANYVARELGYLMTGGWEQGDRSVNEVFAPISTYQRRLGELFDQICALEFTTVDLWTAHLNWMWATDEHVDIARTALAERGLQVASLAGSFGTSPKEFEKACLLARAVGSRILGGSTTLLHTDQSKVVELLEEYDLWLGVENHPEPHPDVILAQIGDGAGGRIGTVVDTGWYGTQGFDAADAIVRLYPHILRVDLKDIRATGAHETCGYGDGVVPIKRCVEELADRGYEGVITVEHEPESYDPTDECRQALAMVRGWLDR